MTKRKTFPVNLRNEDDEALLKEYLSTCKSRDTDGSTEIRKFMKKFINNIDTSSELNQNSTNDNTTNTSTVQDSYYPKVSEYLNKINYVPSYLQNKK